MWYVYIIKCSDNTFYTGASPDVEARLKAHNSRKGAKYTRGRVPVELIYTEPHPSKNRALRREYEIKNLTRKQKTDLIGQE